MVNETIKATSDDLVNLMGSLLSNMELAKLVYYTQANVLSQPNFNSVDIAPFGSKERILHTHLT